MSRRLLLGAREAFCALLDLLYPPTCRICGKATGCLEDFCPICLGSLPGRDQPTCPGCGRRVGPHLGRGSRCAGCQGETMGVDRVVAAAAYRGAVRDLIHRFKFRGERSLGPALGRWVSEAIRQEGVRADLVAPVPLHWRRAIHRGYNQSAILAGQVSRDLRVPLFPRLLRRTRPTQPQSRIAGSTGRESNVRGAFACRAADCRHRTVLLIDDVASSGATLAQCGLAVRRAGASRVIGAVIAR